MNTIGYFALVTFFISILIGALFVPLTLKFKLGQHIREGVPETHKAKEGTPTFGGFIFIIASVITMIIIVRHFDNETKIAIYSLIIFGFVGFIDDSLKILHKQNEGITPIQKIILLLIPSCFFAHYAYMNPSIGTSIIIPFHMGVFDLGIFYIPFIIFFYVATTNAVNLTDGLDGLATYVTITVMVFFTIVSFHFGEYYLSVFCGVLAAALLGFLRYNSFPAKIIMGDTGAIALGGTIATVALILKLPLIVVLVGGIYVFETVTTIIQKAFKQITGGKRLFKSTPIHHAYELSGWHESKIVCVFFIATIILCIIGLLSLF
jgi:phospho-N-acetylmuramoyl-pentapeptide-transferase